MLSNLTLQNGNGIPGGGEYEAIGGDITNAGSLTLIDSTITGGSSNAGGGIFNVGTLSLAGSTLSNNSAPIGGAIQNKGHLSVSGSTFTDNSSYDSVLQNDGTASISGSLFQSGSMGSGRAINNTYAASLTLTGSTLRGNNVRYGGGAIQSGGALTISDSTLSGNSSGFGGGLYVYGGAAVVTNSTIFGNSANFVPGADAQTGYGGAASIRGGTLSLLNDTITGNSDGIVNGGGLDVENSIISGNGSFDVRKLSDVLGSGYPGGAFDDLGHNLIGTASYTLASSDIISSTPNLGPLQDNGGPTETLLPGPGSLALGTGDPTAVDGATDQRGYTRVVDGETDIGAVESDGRSAWPTSRSPARPARSRSPGGTRLLADGDEHRAATGQPGATLADVVPDGTTLDLLVDLGARLDADRPRRRRHGHRHGVDRLSRGRRLGDIHPDRPCQRRRDRSNTEVDDTATVGPTAGDPDPVNNQADFQTFVSAADPRFAPRADLRHRPRHPFGRLLDDHRPAGPRHREQPDPGGRPGRPVEQHVHPGAGADRQLDPLRRPSRERQRLRGRPVGERS